MTIIASALTLFAVLVLAGVAVVCLRLPGSRLGSALVAVVLLLTALLTAVDSVPLLVPGVATALWKKSSLLIEGALVPAWLFCSIIFARKPGQWFQTGLFFKAVTLLSFLFVLLPLLLPPTNFYYCPDFLDEPVLFLGATGFFYYVGIMVCLVIVLVQFESTLTNASPQVFWNTKFFLLGLCLILAVQIFYYSQALLYRTINMDYGPFRAFMFLIAGLMIMFSLFRRDLAGGITVSQHVALKSVALSAVGIYLILLGGFGEGLQYLSGHFTRSVGVSVAFLSGMGLLLLLFSTRVRREIKVVLLKHFYQNKYDYRTQWLLFTEKLCSDNWDTMLQSVLEMYCSTFGVRGAALYLYDKRQGEYAVTATHQMDLKADTLLPTNSLVLFMQERGWVYFIRDQVKDVAEENEEFFSTHKVSFVVPLPGSLGLEGFIVLGPMVKPDESYIFEDFDLMKTYARQAYQTIRQQRLSQELLLSREEAAVGNVATFIMHDLKNQLAALSLITENTPRLISNPEFQKDLVVSLQTTVQKMRDLIGNLKTLDKDKALHLDSYDLLGLVEDCALQLVGKPVVVTGERVFGVVDRNELQKVIMNLLVNALEASRPEKPVVVKVGEDEGRLFIQVQDEGCGMTQEFVQNELFVPFHTTKSTGLGIGLFQSRQIVQAHGGKMTVETFFEAGSIFTVWLPAHGVRSDYDYNG